MVLLLLAAALAATAAVVSSGAEGTPLSLEGKIVYNAPSGDLWTMNADGTQRRRLTRSGRLTDFSPSWSPDGSRVVFRTERGRYVRDPHGSGSDPRGAGWDRRRLSHRVLA